MLFSVNNRKGKKVFFLWTRLGHAPPVTFVCTRTTWFPHNGEVKVITTVVVVVVILAFMWMRELEQFCTGWIYNHVCGVLQETTEK